MSEPEPSENLVPASVEGGFSPLEGFENAMKISQDVGLTECAASEEMDSREKLEQDDQQKDGQTADTSSAGSKFEVGSQCQAVWSEDGLVYPASVVSVDGERCRVRFNGYGNEEDIELSSLKSLITALQTQVNSQDWKPGSHCRAVYSEDGLVYPAVVLWVKDQRCRVRFDNYNNEEDQDISSLLNPDELHGPGRAATKNGRWKSGSTSSNSDGKSRRRKEESQGERGGDRRSAWRDDQQNSSWVKDRSGNHSEVEREAEEKKRGRHQRNEAQKSTSHSFSLFPPFPPPLQSCSGDLSFVPPPPPSPPVWMFGGKESSGSASVDTTFSMLMLWYMCGFHTGSYMAQFKSTSKD